jgi:hypothetical protein
MRRRPSSPPSSASPLALALALAAPVVLSAGAARAQGMASAEGGEAAAPESLPARPRARTIDELANPLRGSTLTLDQSMTTQTAHLEPSPQQSYVPLYELWVSLRPRYWFDRHLSLRARLDYTKELTNNQSTTDLHEDVFGDVWTDLVYSADLDALWPGTKVSAGARALWPTSKVSQASGTFVTAGALGSAGHTFRLRGEGAPTLSQFHLGLSLSYLHPFTTATTPTEYGTFSYARTDTDLRPFTSDQIQGQTLVDHTLWIILDGGLQITRRLSLSTDMIFINQWHYTPSDASVLTGTGTVVVPRSSSDTQFTQNTWFLAALDYALVDEVTLTLGYFNLANAIAPDGQRRGLFGSDNVWWSPDARVFFDVTANLDALWNDARGRRRAVAPGELERVGRR